MSSEYRLMVLHGPNLNLLGLREPEVYGRTSLDGINARLVRAAKELGASLEIHQHNVEGELVERVHACASLEGLVINPAAYTHTSVALRDAIVAVGVPTVEVHLSNVMAREPFRHRSLTAPVCIGAVSGFGVESYILGLRGLIDYLQTRRATP